MKDNHEMRDAREKYKVWDKQEKCFVSDPVYVGAEGLVFDCEGKELIRPTEPARFVAMKYTGFKDKNGVELYDRDVGLYRDGYHPFEESSVAFVEFKNGCWQWDGDLLYEIADQLVCVGNYFQKPGKLKDET